MRRTLYVAGLLSIAAVVLAAHPAAAQSLPSKKEMARIVDAACARLTLGREGSPPFHLIARLHDEASTGKSDGTYELLWASRGRFRESFQFGAISQISVALETKRYLLRNTPYTSYQKMQVDSLLNLPIASPPITGRKVTKVYELTSGGSPMLCADLEDVYQNRKVCVDPATHEIVFDGFGVSSADGGSRFEASDFATIGAARFPLHVVRTGQNETVEIRVESLRRASAFAGDVFTPPPRAIPYDWCPDPITHAGNMSVPPGLDAQISARVRRENGYWRIPPENWAYILVIAPSGRIQEVWPMPHEGQAIDAEVARYFKEQLFPTKTCGGTAIEYERVFDITVNSRPAPSHLF